MRCKKIYSNSRRCKENAIDGKSYCEKHIFPFRYHTFSVNKTSFSAIQEIPTPYESYLSSDAWKERTKIERTKNTNCSLCNRKELLHIHHRTYVRLGSEKDGDLVVLCDECHKLFHKYYKYDGSYGYFIPKKSI